MKGELSACIAVCGGLCLIGVFFVQWSVIVKFCL